MACDDCIHDGVCYLQEVTNDTDEYVKEFGCDDFKNKADFEEVKHGKWSLKHLCAGHYWECSECEFKNCVMPRTNYCPNCGAKMDGGKI